MYAYINNIPKFLLFSLLFLFTLEGQFRNIKDHHLIFKNWGQLLEM